MESYEENALRAHVLSEVMKRLEDVDIKMPPELVWKAIREYAKQKLAEKFGEE